jgi:lactoylglutathione lyase
MTLPLLLRPGRLIVFAPDLTVAKRFYGDVLGLRLLNETARQLEFQSGDFPIDVFKCDRDCLPRAHSSEAGVAMAFQVDDLDEAVQSLRRAGVHVLHDTPGANAQGRYIAFSDPFGVVHELIEVIP